MNLISCICTIQISGHCTPKPFVYASSDSIVDISESTHRVEDREKLGYRSVNLNKLISNAKPKIGPSGVPVVGHPPFHPCNPNPPDFDGKNILKYCKFICLYKAEILEKACTNYIRVIKNWFLKSKEWEDVKNKYPELAMKFLEIGYLEIGNNTNKYLYNQLLI
uniref:Uncharacterized protein n=1 Tax=Meloidogyne floridensis TaxID=298350 RepID=A0A915PAI0_9BILA